MSNQMIQNNLRDLAKTINEVKNGVNGFTTFENNVVIKETLDCMKSIECLDIYIGNVNGVGDAIINEDGNAIFRDTRIKGDLTVDGDINGNVIGDITGNVVGNVNGNIGNVVGAVTGSVGSVTGSVGSVTGSVGSVTGTVGTATSVGSVTGTVTGDITGNVNGNVNGNINGNIYGNINAGAITGASLDVGTGFVKCGVVNIIDTALYGLLLGTNETGTLISVGKADNSITVKGLAGVNALTVNYDSGNGKFEFVFA